MLIVESNFLDSLLKKTKHGRRPGDTNLPPLVREVIAKTSQIDTVKNTASAFGTSHSQAQALSEGVVTRADGENPSLVKKVESFIEAAQEQAASKLLTALESVHPDELKSASLKDKVNAADRLAGVVQKLTPQKGGQSGPQQNVIVFQVPERKKEEEYEKVIDV